MIYLDEQISSHRKILRAGKLIGDAHGGAMAALGLFVAALGYARSHLTDGIVPDEFLQEASRNSDAISSLRKAKLIRKLRGSRWLIHDYLAWNPSAAQVKEQRELSKVRQRRFRGKPGCGKPVRNASVTPLGESEVTPVSRGIPDPRSPIPKYVRTTAQGSLSPVAVEVPIEQRPVGRDIHQVAKQQKNRALSREPAADGNYAVLVKLIHTVMDEQASSDPTSPDVIEAVKLAAAHKRMEYPAEVLNRALRCAGRQRVLGDTAPQGPLTEMVETVRAAIANKTLPRTLRGFTGGRR